MTDWTTIRVRQDAKDDAAEAKRDDENWSEYLQRCTDTPPETQELVPVEDALERLHGGGGSVDTDALAERVSDKVIADLRDH